LRAYKRQAALIVSSCKITVREMSDLLGVTPDKAREIGEVRPDARFPIPAKENSWVLFERGDSSADMSDLIDSLSRRVMPLRAGLVALRNRGCAIKLDLVQWITPADPVGPGFVLGAEVVDLIAEVGGFIDVDQYVDS
jgi:hypothetical protein